MNTAKNFRFSHFAIASTAILVFGSAMAGAKPASAPATTGVVAAIDQPTFVEDVASILHQRCVSCHRPGEISPMSLRTYSETRPWAKSIARSVSERAMPPWDADPGFGPFANDISLDQHEIDTIVQWVKNGAPRGEGDEPTPPQFPAAGAWTLGEPDWIYEFDAREIPASGPDQFDLIPIPTTFPEDRWIRSVEVIPGSPDVVHHFILWRAEESNRNQEAWMSAWAAGFNQDEFPPGTARKLPAGRALIGDFHYHPSGTPAVDKTRIGIRFADPAEVQKEYTNLWILNASFKIPAGDPNYGAKASYVFPQDSHILSLAPHMHYRGKDMAYTAHFPDGTQRELLSVSNYDFNWQTGYDFEQPIAIPAGTRVEVVAHWDNSPSNAANPDPSRDVQWGTDSTDEMLIGFVDYVVDEGISPKPVSLVLGKLAELSEEFPGQVWRFDIQRSPGKPVEPTAMFLPKSGGTGGWYVQLGSLVLPAPIEDVVWDGNRVSATARIPGQAPSPVTGVLDPSTMNLQLEMNGASMVGTPAETNQK